MMVIQECVKTLPQLCENSEASQKEDHDLILIKKTLALLLHLIGKKL